MTLKVIGAGFGRTGTTSIKAALEQLGFSRCYHFTECFRHPSHPSRWEDAWAGRPVDWEQLFDGYQATVDWPGCSFYRDLMERYPDAKVLLSTRDPNRWYESVLGTIYRIPGSLMLALVKPILPHFRVLFCMVEDAIWQGTFDGRFEDREHAIAVFERHNEAVRRYVPAERLLVFDVKQGWGPLCRFLEVEVPDGPFPRLNDAKLIQRTLRYGPWILLVLVATAVAAVVVTVT